MGWVQQTTTDGSRGRVVKRDESNDAPVLNGTEAEKEFFKKLPNLRKRGNF